MPEEHEAAIAALAALVKDLAAFREAGVQAPPPLIARHCRLMPDDEYRLEYCVMLHVAARFGDEPSVGALQLLADDPWWSAKPRVMATWPEPDRTP